MTVRELVDLLNTYASDMPVALVSDGEGNSTAMLSDVGSSAMTAEGELVHPHDVADHEGELTQVVVLWPA